MSARRSARKLFVAVLLGVLVGGGLMAVTPAGAEVSKAAATSWKKIWKKELKPLAAKTFYSKKQSDAKYASKTEAAAAAAAAQSAANTATDGKLGNYYTKAQGDAKYLPKPVVMRGMYAAQFHGTAASQWGGTTINFPVQLAAAPVVHFIPSGGVVPAGCSGTPVAPGASSGHLCVFERYALNRTFVNAYGSDGFSGSDATGAALGFTSAAAGNVISMGTWALGAGALGDTSARTTPVPSSRLPGPTAGHTD